MEGMSRNGSGREEKNFTLKQFLHTGWELAVEACCSLHTGRGKIGLAIVLAGLAWGIFGAGVREKVSGWDYYMMTSDVWCAMGLVVILNLQNYKLLFLLPVSQREFAAMQMRKMAWLCLILFAITAMQYGCMGLDAENFWKNIFWKAIPASISLGSYQIFSMQPIHGKAINGTKLYGLSWVMLLLNLGLALINLTVPSSFAGISHLILPILNYGIGMYAAVYFYRKIAVTELYYDEM